MGFALRIFTVACALAAATIVQAQEQRPTLGVGLRTEVPTSESFGAGGPGSWLCVPISLGAFRLEPELGASFSKSNAGVGTPQQDTRTLGAGLGAFYQAAPSAQSSVYLGGRLSLSMTATKSSATYGNSLAAAAGVEYFPAPFVSLGAEAQARLGFSSNDQTHTKALGAELVGALALRFYVH